MASPGAGWRKAQSRLALGHVLAFRLDGPRCTKCGAMIPKVETIRELISLPSETEALLRAFALKSLKRRATPCRTVHHD